MDAQAKEALAMVCRRLLDIDPACIGSNKGCPFHLVAVPMLLAFRDQLYPVPQKADEVSWEDYIKKETREYHESLPPTLRHMLAADGQGRWCEIGEVQFLADQYLKGDTDEQYGKPVGSDR